MVFPKATCPLQSERSGCNRRLLSATTPPSREPPLTAPFRGTRSVKRRVETVKTMKLSAEPLAMFPLQLHPSLTSLCYTVLSGLSSSQTQGVDTPHCLLWGQPRTRLHHYRYGTHGRTVRGLGSYCSGSNYSLLRELPSSMSAAGAFSLIREESLQLPRTSYSSLTLSFPSLNIHQEGKKLQTHLVLCVLPIAYPGNCSRPRPRSSAYVVP